MGASPNIIVTENIENATIIANFQIASKPKNPAVIPPIHPTIKNPLDMMTHRHCRPFAQGGSSTAER